jgi:hypothetical protein
VHAGAVVAIEAGFVNHLFGRIISLFRREKNLFGQKISVFGPHREFACKPLETQRELTSRSAQMARNPKKYLLFSLLSNSPARPDPASARPARSRRSAVKRPPHPG